MERSSARSSAWTLENREDMLTCPWSSRTCMMRSKLSLQFHVPSMMSHSHLPMVSVRLLNAILVACSRRAVRYSSRMVKSCCVSMGLVRNRWICPVLMAAMTRSRLAWPERMMRMIWGWRLRTMARKSVPDMPGICSSATTMSILPESMSSRAWNADSAKWHWKGALWKARCSPCRTAGSSSTKRTACSRCFWVVVTKHLCCCRIGAVESRDCLAGR
ncbi:hypothetical protein DSECCO2_420650 [anaerobic digester metagenome]